MPDLSRERWIDECLRHLAEVDAEPRGFGARLELARQLWQASPSRPPADAVQDLLIERHLADGKSAGVSSAPAPGPSARVRVGLISDTHGLLRPQAIDFLRGSDLILHAGDVCDAAILEVLGSIAPTIAVRGNNDRGAWAEHLQAHEIVEVAGAKILVLHDLAELAEAPGFERVDVVVSGHSHKPAVHERGGVLFVNPGSAGPRRFKLPISVGELLVEDGVSTARVVELSIGSF